MLKYVACFTLIAGAAMPAAAHTEFKKALIGKYGFKTVSCYTCHARKAALPAGFVGAPKAIRNDFGKVFEKHLKGKNITKNLKAAKDMDDANPNKAKALANAKGAATKGFQAALPLVESEKSKSGSTYGELLKKAQTEEGVLDGIKPPEK